MKIFHLIQTRLGSLGEDYQCPDCKNNDYTLSLEEKNKAYSCKNCGLIQGLDDKGLISMEVK